MGFLTRFLDSRIPASLQTDPESTRHAKLVVYFGFLGSIFGIIYSTFYFIIGHAVGGLIITLCSSFFFLAPWIQRRSKSSAIPANLLAGVTTFGFIALSSVEGGLHGHAIGWLVTVPLICLLLVGEKKAWLWLWTCLIALAVFAGLNLDGIQVPNFYAPRWNSLVNSTGYLGVILFLFILGLIFERGRERTLHELDAANRELRRLDQEKNEFLEIAAHDLKNPLGAIASFAQTIQEVMPAKPQEVISYAKLIRTGADQMLDLVSNLLDVNALEERRMPFFIQPCNALEVIQSTFEFHRRLAEQKQIALVAELPATAVWIRVDPRALRQILDNFLSNAIKYSAPNAKPVTLKVEERPHHWSFHVEDHGPGLSPQDQQKLFGKFARLTPRPTGGESSTGLGLAVVKRLTIEMGGEVSCRSQLGEGTCFTVTFPKEKAPAS